MITARFEESFKRLTGGNNPFPWQSALHQRFLKGDFPQICDLPTGLGKTSVVAIWLIALANCSQKIPRRLVYVVNRRTVVDQTTDEVVKIRQNLSAAELDGPLRELCAIPIPDQPPLAISTLRGEFADNREWSADPARPAVIVGTVDMIGSRLLFSGYGVGFKGKPLHAGFLGQDVLLVHDEAHLEPAFQDLIQDIQREQHDGERTGSLPWPKLRVMALSATGRNMKQESVFGLSDADRNTPEVKKRIGAKKTIHLHDVGDLKKLPDRLTEIALSFDRSMRAVLIFARTVEAVESIAKRLRNAKHPVETLTGTMRGKERDELVDTPVFRRFLPKAAPENETVYLVCTSAGEVGVNISADHLVCDLSTFDSLTQRFGRVNRFGDRTDTEIHVVHPSEFDENDEISRRQQKALQLLRALNCDGSPKALGALNPDDRLAAFAPTPTILPTSDILFDSWALTSIRGKLPGRPPVEPYLHGVSGWEPPETQVAWREEVGVIAGDLRDQYNPEDLLDDYPIKPHELLRDRSDRVFERLKKLKADAETPVWIVSDDGSVNVTNLGSLIEAGKEELSYEMLLLPPAAGGLENGMLASESTTADDVADKWSDVDGPRRVRLWGKDVTPAGMRLIRIITPNPSEADEETEVRSWYWYERLIGGDGDGSKSNAGSVAWNVHTNDVTTTAEKIVKNLRLPDDLKNAVILAARFHDLGKKRVLWQRDIGNPTPTEWLAKSGGKMKLREFTKYRHEFGSLLDLHSERDFQAMNGMPEIQELILHLIAAHHGAARPHFPVDGAFDPEPRGMDIQGIADQVPQRYCRLQRTFGRWGLAYLESLLRAADWAASAKPSAFIGSERRTTDVDT